MWLHSLKVAQLLRSAACLHTNQSRSYLNHLVRVLWNLFYHSRIYTSPSLAPLLSVTQLESSHRFSIPLRSVLNSLNRFLNLDFRRRSLCDFLIDPLNYVYRAANCPSLEDPNKNFYEYCFCELLQYVVFSI